MKQWSKIERDLHHKFHIKELIANHGLKGFGLYIIMRNTVDCYNDMTVESLRVQCMGIARLNMFNSILNNKNLFIIDDNGYVRSSLSNVYAGTARQAHAPTDAPADIHTHTPASEPFNKKEREENKKERESLDDARSFFSKPSLSEISEYISTNGLNIDAHRFYSYYESRGWMMGKSPMVDWKAALRSWISSSYDDYDETSYINDAY